MIPSNFRIEILSIRALLYAIGSKGLNFHEEVDELKVKNVEKIIKYKIILCIEHICKNNAITQKIGNLNYNSNEIAYFCLCCG